MIFGTMHKLTGGSKWFNLVATGSVTSSATMSHGSALDGDEDDHCFMSESSIPSLSSESTASLGGYSKRNEAFYSSSLELNEDSISSSSNYIPAPNVTSPHYHVISSAADPNCSNSKTNQLLESHMVTQLESHIANQLEYLDMIANVEPVKKGNKDRIRYLISLFQLSQQVPTSKKSGTGASFSTKKERKISKSAVAAAAVSVTSAPAVPDVELKAMSSGLLTSSLEMTKADIIRSSSLLFSPEPQYIYVDKFPAVFPAGSRRKGILKSSCALKPTSAVAEATSLTLASPDASSVHSSRRSCHSSPSSYDSCQELPEAARRVVFNKLVHVGEAIPPSQYERKGEYIAKSLTPEVAYFIKKELNQVKSEMYIHESSRCHTQFYVI